MPIVSPLPTGQVNPVLAHWTYGLGRSVAFTSDAGRRWAKTWPDWESYAAFWSQIVRWSMRPVDPGNLTLTVRRDQGRIRVVVDALDKDNQFLNFLQIRGNVVNPDLKGEGIELVQTAPGKYEATFDAADSSGNYFVNLGYRGRRRRARRDLVGRSRSLIPTSTANSARTRRRWKRSRALTDGVDVNFFKTLTPTADPTCGARSTPPTTSAATRAWSTRRVHRPLAELALARRRACSCSTWPCGGSRRTWTGFARRCPTSGRNWSGRGRSSPATEYMEKLKSRKAEVGDQIDRSRSRDPRRPVRSGLPRRERSRVDPSSTGRPRFLKGPGRRPRRRPHRPKPGARELTNRGLSRRSGRSGSGQREGRHVEGVSTAGVRVRTTSDPGRGLREP